MSTSLLVNVKTVNAKKVSGPRPSSCKCILCALFANYTCAASQVFFAVAFVIVELFLTWPEKAVNLKVYFADRFVVALSVASFLPTFLLAILHKWRGLEGRLDYLRVSLIHSTFSAVLSLIVGGLGGLNFEHPISAFLVPLASGLFGIAFGSVLLLSNASSKYEFTKLTTDGGMKCTEGNTNELFLGLGWLVGLVTSVGLASSAVYMVPKIWFTEGNLSSLLSRLNPSFPIFAAFSLAGPILINFIPSGSFGGGPARIMGYASSCTFALALALWILGDRLGDNDIRPKWYFIWSMTLGLLVNMFSGFIASTIFLVREALFAQNSASVEDDDI